MPLPEIIAASAEFSNDELYRYELTRTWDLSRPRICFVMLNPSTADARTDDPTIRRCIGFAARWGFGSLVVVNLYALRATDPDHLLKAPDPCGPKNDAVIQDALRSSREALFAWGCHKSAAPRATRVAKMASTPQCLGTTRCGQPRHPLYVHGERARVPYRPTALQALPSRQPL